MSSFGPSFPGVCCFSILHVLFFPLVTFCFHSSFFHYIIAATLHWSVSSGQKLKKLRSSYRQDDFNFPLCVPARETVLDYCCSEHSPERKTRTIVSWDFWINMKIIRSRTAVAGSRLDEVTTMLNLLVILPVTKKEFELILLWLWPLLWKCFIGNPLMSLYHVSIHMQVMTSPQHANTQSILSRTDTQQLLMNFFYQKKHGNDETGVGV